MPGMGRDRLIPEALAAEVITETQAALLREAEAVRSDAIQVDAFTLEEYLSPTTNAPSHPLYIQIA